MSAFVVNDRHIDYMLAAGLKYGRDGLRWLDPADTEETDFERGQVWGATAVANAQTRTRELTRDNISNVGRMLLLANARSVAFRYDEPFDLPLYDYTTSKGDEIDAVQTIKAVACFRYQSCERPEWERSEAAAFCDALERAAINHLNGYADAKWEIV
jgi:hypothetical protein